MTELILPHQKPVRFASHVITRDGDKAIVQNEFGEVPSLGMIIEAAAQSTIAIALEEEIGRVGFLTTLKNVKLHSKPTISECQMHIELLNRVSGVGHLSFEAKQNGVTIASGGYVVVIQ
ncbi:hypothetical protein FJR48_10895 [Sulfurimonas lithotrophica]|uniref:Thioesterase n=1 Tax=Sulfurimonas lithotrophica TaxID=2590022 RepID=A0A5P8P385_9BACT|nr:hypothetical protein [Sulfurimonas lithotrophica]QFR50208.1 hypothetical protein FJR48_10895 [Sulfurimonas lithotrophica]